MNINVVCRALGIGGQHPLLPCVRREVERRIMRRRERREGDAFRRVDFLRFTFDRRDRIRGCVDPLDIRPVSSLSVTKVNGGRCISLGS